jgi:hypothetical protein
MIGSRALTTLWKWIRVLCNKRKREFFAKFYKFIADFISQSSGELNDKTQQLLELQALAQQQFAAMQASFAEGMKTAKEVQRDLEWTQKKVTYVKLAFPCLNENLELIKNRRSLNKRAARKYPQEYSMAQDRYPSTLDF